MSAEVPPMSIVMTLPVSQAWPVQRPPMTPPAGPDRRRPIGRSTAFSMVEMPPFDCMTRTMARMPAALRRPSRLVESPIPLRAPTASMSSPRQRPRRDCTCRLSPVQFAFRLTSSKSSSRRCRAVESSPKRSCGEASGPSRSTLRATCPVRSRSSSGSVSRKLPASISGADRVSWRCGLAGPVMAPVRLMEVWLIQSAERSTSTLPSCRRRVMPE
ncbi:MAG: hypothetical protein BWY77_00144 [bacterium ADurb.Bin431]|nr:MAG: hypothetical protein BWY77_00144 [bacterium ADurb.Bin431]